MKQLLLSGVALLLLAVSNGYAAEDTVKLVNLDKSLPAEVKLTVGESVYFHRADSEGVSKTVSSKSASLTEQEKRQFPKLSDSTVIAGYTATCEGSGEIEVTRQVVSPSAKPSVTKIKVTVEPKVAVVDLDGKLPATLNVTIGQDIQFTGSKHFLKATIEAPNGGASDVVKELPSRINPPVFRGEKRGYCLFTVTYSDTVGGAKKTHTITVVVEEPVAEIDLGAALPANLTVKVGTSIRFTSKVPGARMFNSATVTGTDGKPSDGVEVSPLRRYPPAFDAKKAGTYQFTFSFRYHPKEPVQTHTINITVK
ncbi:MAG: hypothetical protein K2W95_31550 [Candidatus Obscuribacterales bacterium]|nr:hypothetical protein [Candidatus Obscuribacterales bacterium]